MVKSARSHMEVELDDNEELVVTNHNSSYQVKVDAKATDQKPATPRSKHSATEQRRRTKINERFQILRDLIPQNDQKRDKASFLLEVIEYIQFLQQKLHMYEGSYNGWNQDQPKLIQWGGNHEPVQAFVDHSSVIMNGSDQENNVATTPTILTSAQNLVESDSNMGATYKTMDHSKGTTTQTVPPNVPLLPNMYAPVGRGGVLTHTSEGSFPDVNEHMANQAQSPLDEVRACTTECTVSGNVLNEQELMTESGAVNISNAYSQGLLNTLTQALQSSGIDMSQASISVEVDVKKQESGGLSATTYYAKDVENLSPCNRAMANSGVGTCGEDFDRAYKRIRKEKS